VLNNPNATSMNRKDKIKVVHFSSAHSPTDVRIFQRECRALAEAGYRVTYVAPECGNRDSTGLEVKVVVVPRLAGRVRRFTITLFRVVREAWREHGEIYHFHDPDLIPVGLLMRLLGKQVVYDAHENLPHQALYSRALPVRLRRLASGACAGLERYAARRFSGIVAADSEIANRLRPFNSHVITLENYPVLEESMEAPEHGTSRFFSGVIANFGGISSRTCTRSIVEALALLPPELNAHMIIGGRCMRDSLRAELESLPGWSLVNYQGPITRPRMFEQLSRSALALALFSDEPNHHDVRSNRLFEALAAGVPVITSNFPKWHRLVNRVGCGITVDPSDSVAIARAIEFLLDHPTKAEEMGRRGRETFLNELNWNKERPRLIELYAKLSENTSKSQVAGASLSGTSAHHTHIVPGGISAIAVPPAVARKIPTKPSMRFERIDLVALANTGLPFKSYCQSAAWLGFLAETQRGEPIIAQLVQDGAIAGYFAGMIVRKLGAKILGSPFPGWSTPYMGLSLVNGTCPRDAVNELVRFAFEELRCLHLEFMDRDLMPCDVDGLGFQHRILSSFQINLRRAEGDLLGAMTSACRRCIRKAEKSGVEIEEVREDPSFANEYYDQLKDVFAKRALVPTYDLGRVRSLIHHLEPVGNLLLLRARDCHGRSIATGIFPAISEKCAYFWGMASWREYQILRPNEALLWHAIRYWKARGFHKFDMGGGGEYKRKYGGEEIAVPWLRLSKYPLIPPLREAARKSIELRQRILGRMTLRAQGQELQA
jgi:glycosyltransferase involved in cell wall biosynthesis